MNVRFYLSYDIKISLKFHFWREKVKVLSCSQPCYGHHYIKCYEIRKQLDIYQFN